MIEQTGSVSAVICAYTFDRLDDVVAAVASIANQTRPPIEILVVVDHNPPLEMAVETRTNGRARIVANKYERGLSGARNTGVAHASGDFIMFLDDDAKADSECLERLLLTFDDPRVIGAGGWIYPGWPGRPRWFPDEFLWTVGCSYRGLAPGPTRNLLGAAMCMRRSLFTRVGGFDSSLGRSASARLPYGCEETEFCLRATQTIENSLFVLEPEAHITHTVTHDRTKLRYFIQRCYAEGLSKSRLAVLVGSDRPLASERLYVTKTLARGFLRNLGDPFLRRDPSGFLRAPAIGIGLACTVAGFFVARVKRRGRAWRLRSETKFAGACRGRFVSIRRSGSLILSGLKAKASQAFGTHQTFFVSAGHLAFGTGSAAALGFVYWWFAARAFPPSSVGYAAGAISLMNFIGHFGEFGLGALMIGAAHRFKERAGSFIGAAIAVASLSSGIFAIAYLALSIGFPGQLGGIVGGGGGVVFLLGCTLTGFTLVLDQALIGLLKARLQAVRNLVFAVTKLTLLIGAPLVLAGSALRERTILATWVVGQALSILLLLLPGLRASGILSVLPDLSMLEPLVPEVLAHHCLNLANLAPTLLLPFLVTICLTPATNAAFYTAWTIVNVAFLIPASLATVLFAIGSQDPTRLAAKMRTSLVSSLVAAAFVAATCFIGARLILGVFSPIYAEIGTRSLQVLGLSMIPVSIKYHYVSVQRIRGRMATASLLQAFGGALELAGAVAGARFGDLTGFTTGWLLGLCIEAALMFPIVFSALSSSSDRALKASATEAPRLARLGGTP